jgi:sigma-B regulation protein RsbU (phosphoserine phosphatase)
MIPSAEMPAVEGASAGEPKRLYRLVEPIYDSLDHADPVSFYCAALARTASRLAVECGITSTLLARRDGPDWALVAGDDETLANRVGRMEVSERELLASHRVLFSASGGFPIALWALGPRGEWLAALRLARIPDETSALLIQMARLAVHHRAMAAAWTSVLDRAREIQLGLLPDPLPALPGFEIAARSESAEEVGGDVFDAIALGEGALGLTIADASGHGLPAALEARDVVVGLRMGAACGLPIDATVERLNRILCSSTLSSRFVSMVYGELESDGALRYVNAGHPPPLLLTPHGREDLDPSGRVLGVSEESVYRVGRAWVPPGGLLLLYTDGVTECPSPAGEEFGIERLAGIASVLAGARAAHLCAAVFEAMTEHAAGLPLPDDASLLVARRLSTA